MANSITMHNTKGLEFDRVFVVGLEDEIIPGRSTETEREMEEERRILYVAMTRSIRSFSWIEIQGKQNLSWQNLIEPEV